MRKIIIKDGTKTKFIVCEDCPVEITYPHSNWCSVTIWLRKLGWWIEDRGHTWKHWCPTCKMKRFAGYP